MRLKDQNRLLRGALKEIANELGRLRTLALDTLADAHGSSLGTGYKINVGPGFNKILSRMTKSQRVSARGRSER